MTIAHMFTTLAQAQPDPGTPAAEGDGSTLVFWIAALIALSILVFALEVAVPSGGLLGMASAACAVIVVVLLFCISVMAGMIGLLCLVIAIPVALWLSLKLWPLTPVAKWLTLRSRHPAQSTTSNRDLIGAQGQAITDLRPVGICEINGDRHECLADTGMIDRGARVTVVSADGMQIKVRLLT